MKNNVGGQKSGDGPGDAAPRRSRGRPRQWNDAPARKQAYEARRRARTQQLEELYQALLNARWDDPELARTVACGKDEEVLPALLAYFRQRHWMQRP